MRVGQIRILAWAFALVIAALLFFCGRSRNDESRDVARRPSARGQSPPALLPIEAPAALLPIPSCEPPAAAEPDASVAPRRTSHAIGEPAAPISEPDLTSAKPYRLPDQGEPQKVASRLPLDVLLSEPPRQRSAIEPRVAKDLPRAPDAAPDRPAPLPILATANPAMEPVNAIAWQHVVRGFSLGDKAAVYAARTEFIQALRTITEAVDAQAGLTPQDPQSFTMALVRALQALTEADDFAPSGGRLDGNLDLNAIIATHRTPACKQRRPATQLAAMQAYFDFARDELQRAAAASPTASQALTGLGKSYTVPTERNQPRLAPAKAMVFHQAAVAADPCNHLAANELGVLLARHGQWEPAKQSFLQSLRVQPDAVTWQNLAGVHRHLGEHELARLALQERETLIENSSAATSPTIDGKPTVQWVDPKAFAGPPEDGLPVSGIEDNSRSAARSSAPKSWLKLR